MFIPSAEMPKLESMARVLKHIEDHQRASGICPENYSAIGREVSLSHTHVRRLVDQAVKTGLLTRSSEGVSYSRISQLGSVQGGGAKVPRVTVAWDSPMIWTDTDSVWLDPALFGIHPQFPHWLVQFRKPEPREHPSSLCLGPDIYAIVRKCPPDYDRTATQTWWLVEDAQGCVTPMRLINAHEFYLPDPALGRKGFTIRVDEAIQAVRIVLLFERRDP